MRPLNTTVRRLKTSRIEFISNVGSLHIGPLLLHTSPFQPVVQVVLCIVKNLKKYEIFYGTQYDPNGRTVVLSIFSMGKMVI
jgi:hypothetical protein